MIGLTMTFLAGMFVGWVVLAFLQTIRQPPHLDDIVLDVIADLGGRGYGVTIRHGVERAIQRGVSFGTIYACMDRLEDAGLITTWQADATAERGWRQRRYAKVVTL